MFFFKDICPNFGRFLLHFDSMRTNKFVFMGDTKGAYKAISVKLMMKAQQPVGEISDTLIEDLIDSRSLAWSIMVFFFFAWRCRGSYVLVVKFLFWFSFIKRSLIYCKKKFNLYIFIYFCWEIIYFHTICYIIHVTN